MRTTFILAIVFAMSIFNISKAQYNHDHHHSRNEIGLSSGGIYSLEHKSWGKGMHLHYYRTFNEHSKWSFGVMSEYVRTHDAHFTFGAGIKYQPFENLGIAVLPGMTFLQHEHDDEHSNHRHDEKIKFSVHFELIYDLLHWGNFHLGPVVDFSWSKNDAHGMIGIHAAYCF